MIYDVNLYDNILIQKGMNQYLIAQITQAMIQFNLDSTFILIDKLCDTVQNCLLLICK